MLPVPVIVAGFDAWDPCGLIEMVLERNVGYVSRVLGTSARIMARL